MRFDYVAQPRPEGLAQAYLLAEDVPRRRRLDDGPGRQHLLRPRPAGPAAPRPARRREGGTVFGYHVADPERYGVVDFDAAGRVLSIEEKPARPKSNFAVTGIYVLDGSAPARARALTPERAGRARDRRRC